MIGHEYKGTLLIVDDVPANVAMLFDFLTDAGFKVLVAQEGLRAIQKAEYAKPDLILLDVMMPDMNGFEVCRIIKMQESTRDIPIIFMTALTETVNKVKGFEVGAADYITKPIQQEEVLARINTHLKLHRLQKQLQTYTNELEKRNQELEAFARTVAHDLKNPLSGVIHLSERLVRDYDTAPDFKIVTEKSLGYLKLINNAGEQMSDIIDALLLLAGVSTRQQVEIKPLDMQMILQEVTEKHLANLIDCYKGELSFPNVPYPTVIGYAPWIEQVWANYLSNGLKYGGTPPELTIGFEEQANSVSFWVQDNGVGLSIEAQEKLFTPFTRLHENRIDGHGLGLSIVRQIMDKLQGHAGVHSALGQGSRFYFTLPKAVARVT
ncbi:bacteriophytochrome (light-regulated signal transduction histidine kinase) [Beggiatoa alba B18LD]|uniref:histidine kinase n=1 Tax=Beggiatoa alba B18LD TaxID=395493 RepID=I3CHY2_9GAMM|nr:hybrid sensor histidine kinase/response regulator [Beggiatoa alba]EIJ43225.1 bacteriophytochrome (light-regulated signal transduction histidine kinase) [Beggiatoa alba B18LD]